MCLGVPMRIERFDGDLALCRAEGSAERRAVSTLLLDASPSAGDWLLVHVNTAVRALSAEEARLITDALGAVAAAAAGDPFEHLIADLIDREPELPEHLRPKPGEPT